MNKYTDKISNDQVKTALFRSITYMESNQIYGHGSLRSQIKLKFALQILNVQMIWRRGNLDKILKSRGCYIWAQHIKINLWICWSYFKSEIHIWMLVNLFSSGRDTGISVWSPKWTILKRTNTKQLETLWTDLVRMIMETSQSIIKT